MKKKNNKKTTIEHKTIKEDHVHHHIKWDDIIEAMLVFLIVIMAVSFVIRVGEHSMTRFEDQHTQCLNTCGQKHFKGIQLGEDLGVPITLRENRLLTRLPYVVEYDRTQCIENCNDLYYALQTREDTK